MTDRKVIGPPAGPETSATVHFVSSGQNIVSDCQTVTAQCSRHLRHSVTPVVEKAPIPGFVTNKWKIDNALT